MIKALVKDKVTLTVEPGSIVLISEGQFKALGDKAEAYKEEAKEVKEESKEEKTTSKKTSKGKKKGEE